MEGVNSLEQISQNATNALQLHATNCHLELALIVLATILHLWPFLQLCYNYICN